MADQPSPAVSRKTIRALLLSERIDTSKLQRDNAVSNTPLAYRCGSDGLVTVFRYGVAVLFNLSSEQEAEALAALHFHLIRPAQTRDEETATIEVAPDKDEQILPGGPITLKMMTPESVIVIADALSKSVVLARNEREVAPRSTSSSRWRVTSPRPAARRTGDAPSSSTSAPRCWCSTASRAASPSPRSPRWCGTALISTGSMAGSKMNTSSRNAPKSCRRNSR
jgi:hypothetical protein